ncbi:MAG: putative sugar nucleotidyl transferase [Muribaculaceae bacterium]|jgi:UDP-N-acetylglucosamine diphosphorylase/glucosamine-1-phosphate N-acetyltransferase|nr:putative sugar nucleotidyl transferase [Muribaculaceae bacterium]
MKIIIYDNAAVRSNILPLSYTRPLGALRIGIDTIAEKWQAMLTGEYLWSPAADYLAEIFPSSDDADALYVAGHIIPDKALAEAVASLRPGQKLMCNHEEVAHYGTDATDTVEYCGSPDAVHNLYDIFMLNNKAVEADFERITAGRQSLPLSPTNTIIGDASKIFIEEGARVEGAFLNTCAGPIYIGRDAEIMEGSMLRGPIALCEHAVVNMGTKIYPGTTLGPYCKVGGELNNVVMLGYSNKAHDGFLGNAVIGEWCNLGAGCVASNLKNDYSPIRLWNYSTAHFERTGLQFCGLIMGDHSKAGINTMFNTATVLGVGVNVHGSGFPRNFVPSFSEGGASNGFSDVSMTKFFEIARRMMARRHIELTIADERMFYAIRQAAENFK